MPRIRSNECPGCGFESTAATCLEDETLLPKKGDLSICFECGEFLQYGKDLTLHTLPEEVLDDIHQECLDEMLAIRKKIIHMKNTRKTH